MEYYCGTKSQWTHNRMAEWRLMERKKSYMFVYWRNTRRKEHFFLSLLFRKEFVFRGRLAKSLAIYLILRLRANAISCPKIHNFIFFFALAPIFFSERTNESDSFHFSRCWSVCVCMFFFPFFAFLVRSRSVSRKTHQNKKLVFLFTYAVEKPTATTTTSYGRWHRQPNNWNENEIFKRK